MSLRRHLSVCACLVAQLAAGCFNPTGTGGDSTGGSTAAPTTDSTGATTTPDPGTTTTGTTALPDSTTSTDTTAPVTTAPDECPAECPPEAPYCDGGTCVGCKDFEDLSCAALFPDQPNCDADSGVCVACLADIQCAGGLVCHQQLSQCVECEESADCGDPAAPVCDQATHTCRACEAHAECGERACERETGKCFPESALATAVRYAEPGAGGCDAHDCLTPDTPCCSVAQALIKLQQSNELTHVVVHLAGTDNAPVNVTGAVLAGRAVALRGTDGAALTAKTNGGSPTVWLNNGAAGRLYLADVDVFDANGAAAVACTTGDLLWVDDARISNAQNVNIGNPAPGLYGENCDLHADRTVIVGNQIGVRITGDRKATLRNTIVAGSTNELRSEIEVDNGARLELVYATVGDTNNKIGSLLAATSALNVTIRNSALVAGPNDTLVITAPLDNLTIDYSAVPSEDLLGRGSGNVYVADPVAEIDFKSWPNDLRLDAPGLLANVARWQPGDPRTDLEGAPRPARPDTPDVAGADLP